MFCYPLPSKLSPGHAAHSNNIYVSRGEDIKQRTGRGKCNTKKTAKPTKHGQKKNARNNNEKENKEQEGEKCNTKKTASKPEVARKKAEREKKKAEIEKDKEVKARGKAAQEKERGALMQRDNGVPAEMTSFASSLSGSKSSGQCQRNEPPSSDTQHKALFYLC